VVLSPTVPVIVPAAPNTILPATFILPDTLTFAAIISPVILILVILAWLTAARTLALVKYRLEPYAKLLVVKLLILNTTLAVLAVLALLAVLANLDKLGTNTLPSKFL